MNKILGFGIWFQHSAQFLFNAVQTNLVSYPRPETTKAVTVQITRCSTFIAREDSGCSGDGQESKSSAGSRCFSTPPCPRRQQWLQELIYSPTEWQVLHWACRHSTSPVLACHTAEGTGSKERVILIQILAGLVSGCLPGIPTPFRCLFFFFPWKKSINKDLGLTQITYCAFYC